MQRKYSTKIEINKVGIGFTSKKITAYGGFSLMALFFEKIKLRENLEKIIPEGYNQKKKGRGSHSPLLALLNKSRYVVNLLNRPGNVASWNNILGFFQNTWKRVDGFM